MDQSTQIPAADRIDPEFAALPLRTLADAALQRAADLGAQHADFRAERVRGQRIRLSDARLETLLDADDVGLARVAHSAAGACDFEWSLCCGGQPHGLRRPAGKWN